jgi:hypothetical protein
MMKAISLKIWSIFWMHLANFTFITLMMPLSGCKKDSPLSDQEKVTAMLTAGTGKWEAPVVTVDGVDYSDLYRDFSIKFEKTTYTTTAGAPIWKSSGTWAFIDEEATFMKLDNDPEVEINSISNDFLELSFLWNQDTFEPGRIRSIRGKQKFRLRKIR